MQEEGAVARRTRSRLESYYRNLHRSIKINPTTTNANAKAKDEEEEKIISIHHDLVDDKDREDLDVISINSESESECDDDEEVKQQQQQMNKKRRRKKKKKQRSNGEREIDLDLNIDIDRESVIISGEVVRSILPLKFKLDDGDDDQDEKSRDEKSEIDRLFDELEVALWESHHHHHHHHHHSSNCVSGDDVLSEESRAGKCSRGEHLPFLDEEIGIICSFCRSLLLPIKYVLPPFCAEPSSSPPSSSLKPQSNTPPLQTPSSSFSSTASNYMPPSSFKVKVKGGNGGTVFDLIPPSDKELYPHQLQGFELIWRNIGGHIHLNNLHTLSSGSGTGSGCIISHAPGTGKTRLTIVFLQTLFKLHPTSRPLIIAPRGMLLTWEQELLKWNAGIPFHNLNDSSRLSPHHQESSSTIAHQLHNKSSSLDSIRLARILSWIKGGSILGVGYRLFEELTRSSNHKFNKILLESPTLLILDEGHTPRNDQTLMWKVLTKVTTQRRIILSGTPFQNNFDELYNTLSLVNPRFSQQLATIGGGQCRKRGYLRRRKSSDREEWANLTNSITRSTSRNDQAIKKLRAMIQPFVHVHKGAILEKTLPGLKDCLIILNPTPLQQKLLDHNVARVDNFLEQAHLASLISVHPSLVAQEPHFADHRRKLNSLESDPRAGVKTHFLINLIDISSRINEKVLIFSEFIKPLLHIKKLLKSHFSYNEGRQVMYIDGDLSMKQRQSLITCFNNKNGEARVLLASQKACCEGISLVGASRVVLLDVSWNPSVERQAICRAYRLGQEKMVYVYHLITLMEAKKYARQAEKDRISELVFGEGERGVCCRESVCEDKVLEAMVDHQGSMFERIVHQPKESDFVKDFGFGDLDF